MSSVKISGLPTSSNLNANPAHSIFPTVDTDTGQTTQISGKSLGNTLYANNTLTVGSGGVILPNTVAQFTGISGGYTQVNEQNLNANGTADFIVTADVGTDTYDYIDMGITNSNYNNLSPYNSLGTATEPLSGYLYVQGGAAANSGNLAIGTVNTNSEIKFFAGGINDVNVMVKIRNGELKARSNTIVNVANTLLVNTVQFYDGTKQTTAAASNAYSQAAFATANSAQANTIITQGVDATQNATLVYLQAGLNTANANTVTNAANITYLFGIESTQNTNIQLAWNQANTSLQNTTNITVNTNIIVPNTIIGNTASFSGNISANYVVANNVGNAVEVTLQAGNNYWNFYANNNIYSTANTWTGPLYAPSANIGSLYLANNNIYSSNTSLDINFGQLTSTANINFNRTSNFYKGIVANNGIIINDNSLYQYSTANNTTVTQLTDKTTAVTSNGRTGQITTTAASLASGRSVTFTVNCSQIVSAKDLVIVNIASGATINTYGLTVTAVAPGSFSITISNNSNAAAADTLVINYAIIRVN